jgi:hypothetical protein
MRMIHARRRFITGLSLSGGAGFLRAPGSAAEDELGTTSVRFMRSPTICHAPQFVVGTGAERVNLKRTGGFRCRWRRPGAGF